MPPGRTPTSISKTLWIWPAWKRLGKRVRNAPKIYFRDSGLFHALLGIRSLSELRAHPKLSASWKGLALEHVLRVLRVEPGEGFHWGTHGGAELDLLLVGGGRRWGVELKYVDAPRCLPLAPPVIAVTPAARRPVRARGVTVVCVPGRRGIAAQRKGDWTTATISGRAEKGLR